MNTKHYKLSEMLKDILILSVIVAVLGYIDFATGEISIEVLYILCICFVTWHSNMFVGLLNIIEIVTAKTMIDYYDQIKIGSHLYGWNTLNYLAIYIIVCILVSMLKKALSK